MTGHADLPTVLACPRCDTRLDCSDEVLHCQSCKIGFPRLGGIPFLFAEPDYALAEWRARSNFALAKLNEEAAAVERELQQDNLLDLTRSRLEHLRNARSDQSRRLAELMKPLGAGSPAAAETYLALRTRLPPDQGLNTYFANLHRDWAWGDEENRLSCAQVAEAFTAAPQRLLVLGAGAGRLACDLHHAIGAQQTVALDFNPLLMLALQRLLNGESLHLYEFPLAPRSIGDQAVLRELRAGQAAAPIELVLGDVQRAPFVAGAFDAVVTPWLSDILPTDFRRLASTVNRLLGTGGRWVNFGSLAFAHRRQALCYSVDEVMAIMADSGFADSESRETDIPYMCSPASRHGRTERVVTVSAVKRSKGPKLPRYRALPDWLVTGQEPVPLTSDFQVQAGSTRIHAFLMSLIDGKRTLRQMAELLEEQRLMPRDEAEASIRAFLIRMYDDSR